MLSSIVSFFVSMPMVMTGLAGPADHSANVVAVADPVTQVTESIQEVNNAAQVNGSQCGSAAKEYGYNDTKFSGSFCKSGQANPGAPEFPGRGGAVSWTCGQTGGYNEVGGPFQPECPFNPTPGRTIVTFGDGTTDWRSLVDRSRRVLAWTRSWDSHETAPKNLNLSKGTYTVTLASYDRRWAADTKPHQEHEQWEAVILNGNKVVAVTEMTPDLSDHAAEDCTFCKQSFLIKTVQDDLVISTPTTKVYGHHPFYPLPVQEPNAHSHTAVCVAFDKNGVVNNPPADDWCTATRADAADPDLDPRPTQVSSGSVARGGQIEFTARVDNDGNAVAGPYNMGGFYIDHNGDGVADYTQSISRVTGNTNPGGMKTKKVTWDVPTDAPIGTYRVGYTADVDDEVSESKEGNNWSGWTSFSVNASNPTGTLTVCESGNPGNCATSGTLVVAQNDTVEVSWTTEDTTACEVDASVGPDNWSPATNSTGETSSPVTATVTYSATCDGTNGSTDVPIGNVTVDPTSGPDLVADPTQLSVNTVKIGENITFTTDITNSGSENAGSYTIGGFDVDTNNDGNPDYTFAAGTVNGTTVGENETVAVNVTIPVGMPTGTNRVRYIADVNNDVAETNEGNNNSGWTDFTVEAAPAPQSVSIESCMYDGVVSDCHSNPRQINSGDQIAIRWDSVGATACAPASGPYFATGDATSGTDTSASEPDPGENRVYSVVCENNGTWSAPASVSVEKIASTPTVGIIPGGGGNGGGGGNNGGGGGSPSCEDGVSQQVRIGDTIEICYDSTDSDPTSCTLTGGPINPPITITTKTGTAAGIQINGTTTFTLDCEFGISTVTVNIIPGVFET